MNVLVFTGHPAQIHNFRKLREKLEADGHKVFWLTSDKDIALQLLGIYNIPYEVMPRPKKSLLSQISVLLHNTWKVIHTIRRHKIDIVVSRTDPYTAIGAWVCRRPHILFADTELAVKNPKIGVFTNLPDVFFTSDSFWLSTHREQLHYAGNIETFYLHPNEYKPSDVSNLLGIRPGTKFAVVRFVKWNAFHDAELKGGFTLEQKRELVRRLAVHMRVFISSETELPADLEPYRIRIPVERMHDVQAAASLFVGESATMASESVVLGTPAVYIDEVGRGYTDEEARENLLYMFRPVPNKDSLLLDEKEWIMGGVEECIETAEMLASPDYDIAAWKNRHEAWMQTKIDPTAWLTWMIENYPQSVEDYRTNRAEIEKRFK